MNHIELNIRKSWDLIRLGEYLEYQAILLSSGTTTFTKHIEILALLADVPTDRIRSLPAKQVTDLFEHLDFLKEEPTIRIQKTYEFGGRKYQLYRRIEEISAGQFIDLTEYCKDATKLLANTANILATVLIPIIEEDDMVVNGVRVRRKEPLLERYLQTPRHETVESILNNMPVSEALSIASFFILLLLSYTEVTRKYLEDLPNRSSSISMISATAE